MTSAVKLFDTRYVDMTIRRGEREADIIVILMVDIRLNSARIIGIQSQDPDWQPSDGLTEEEQHGAVCAAWEQVGAALRTAEVPS